MISLKNKKGAESTESPIGGITGIIVIVIVAVIVIIGVTGAWKYIFNKQDLLPGDLSTASAACATWAGSSVTSATFCEYKEMTLEGTKQYANCVHVFDVANKTLQEKDIGFRRDAVDCKQDAQAYCRQLKTNEGAGFKDSVVVNGKACRDLIQATCEDVGGVYVNAANCLQGKNTLDAQVKYPAQVLQLNAKVKACCQILNCKDLDPTHPPVWKTAVACTADSKFDWSAWVTNSTEKNERAGLVCCSQA
jgi:hypothetical protein